MAHTLNPLYGDEDFALRVFNPFLLRIQRRRIAINFPPIRRSASLSFIRCLLLYFINAFSDYVNRGNFNGNSAFIYYQHKFIASQFKGKLFV